eukprot:Rmarinus@m.11571
MTVRVLPCPYVYLVTLLETECESIMSAETYLSCIRQAKCSMFGEIGGAFETMLLKYDPETNRAIIRVPRSRFEEFWGALTCMGEYAGAPCRITVVSASTNLGFAASGLL